MPAWSPEVANEFIGIGRAEGKAFSQMHLQELVYIAHAWCLILTGEPLTGDRPEAFEHGPEYRRLADALKKWGAKPVDRQIDIPCLSEAGHKCELSPDERAILERVYSVYASIATSRLATLTRAPGTPWERVFAGGSGNGRDIHHLLIKKQFERLAAIRAP